MTTKVTDAKIARLLFDARVSLARLEAALEETNEEVAKTNRWHRLLTEVGDAGRMPGDEFVELGVGLGYKSGSALGGYFAGKGAPLRKNRDRSVSLTAAGRAYLAAYGRLG